MKRHHVLRRVVVTALICCPMLLWAGSPLPHAQPERIPAVALSNAPGDPNAPHVAWIVTTAGTTRLMLATLTGKDTQAVAIPGSCAATGLRWARGGYPLPRTNVWHELAIMTHCSGDGMPMQSVVWLLDTSRVKEPLRKIADLGGYAHCMEWTAQDKGIAFLYVPGATRAPTAATSGDCESHSLSGMSAVAADAQRVAMVSLADARVEAVTPPGMDVYAFDWTAYGKQGVLYIATRAGGARWDAKLYRKWGNASTAQWLVMDPATTPQLRGRHISMPSWDTYFPMVYFLGIPNIKGATGGDLYHVSASGGTPVNLTKRSTLKPSWIALGGRLGTRRDGDKVEVMRMPTLSPPYTTVKILFSVPGTLTDGRAPLAVASGSGGVAYVQSSPGSAPEVHSGPFRGAYGPPVGPPAITSNGGVNIAVAGKR